MRLVFVHGINNEGRSTESIRNEWRGALEEGWSGLGLKAKTFDDSAAFYGDILAEATKKQKIAIEQGGRSPAAGLAIQLLREYVDDADVSEDELRQIAASEGVPIEAIEMGVPHEGWVIAFAQVLEKVLPTKGKYIAKLFLKQASVYIGDAALAAEIEKKVLADVFDGKPDPAVVIGHSLGSVVTYRLLANKSYAGSRVPLLVTLGSPLGIKLFRQILPQRASVPTPPIGKWINGRHNEDFVTLGRAVDRKAIGFDGVTDITQIVNNTKDKHDIKEYLKSPEIAKAIYDAL